MSMTLNLAEHLLATGRHFQTLGRDDDAVRALNRLTSFKQIPSEVGEEAKARLAEMLLRAGRFTRARKHLTALLVQCPNNARYHYLMAGALDGDERSDPERAAEHYSKSLKFEPQQPRCLGEYGLLLLRLGRSDEGLQQLRRAAEMEPNQAETVERLSEGLRQEGRVDEARAVLRAARFRNPRDPRFTKLWNDFQFRQLREEQQAKLGKSAGVALECEGPRILPFVRPETAGTRLRTHGKVVRSDAASALQPPRIGKSEPLPGKKHA